MLFTAVRIAFCVDITLLVASMSSFDIAILHEARETTSRDVA